MVKLLSSGVIMTKIEVGDYVKYTGCTKEQTRWGNNDDPVNQLTVNGIYCVTKVNIRSSHTKISLHGYEKFKFNSVCFETLSGGWNYR